MAAIIPNVFSDSSQKIIIGSQSLNQVVFDDQIGHFNETACEIDERIYAYLDDNYFSLSMEEFLQKVKFYLD